LAIAIDALDGLSLRWRRHKAAAAEIAAEEARREQREADEALKTALLAAQARQREREESMLKAKHAAGSMLSEKASSLLGVLEASPLKMDLGLKKVWKKAIANTLSEADEWSEWMRNEIEVCVPLSATECH
jgi:hypothetical protein